MKHLISQTLACILAMAALVGMSAAYGLDRADRFEIAIISITWLVLIVAPVMLARLFAHVPPPDAPAATSAYPSPSDVGAR